MTITRNFKLCLNAGTQNAPYINVNQYDEGEQWIFDLYTEGGQKFTPSTGAIIGIKADGNAILNAGTVNASGQVVITETEQMTAASGLAVFELLIEGETHGTANFIVNVERRPSDDAEFSDSDLSLLQQAVDSAAEIEDLLGGQDVPTVITPIISDWLDENITNPSNPPIDTSLTVAGAAADAKKTGDEITDLKNAIMQKVTDFQWTIGSVAASQNGIVDTSYYLNRIVNYRTLTIDEFIDASTGTGSQISPNLYDENNNLLGNLGAWVTSCTKEQCVQSFPNAKFVKIIFRRTDNANCSLDDIETFSLTVNAKITKNSPISVITWENAVIDSSDGNITAVENNTFLRSACLLKVEENTKYFLNLVENTSANYTLSVFFYKNNTLTRSSMDSNFIGYGTVDSLNFKTPADCKYVALLMNGRSTQVSPSNVEFASIIYNGKTAENLDNYILSPSFTKKPISATKLGTLAYKQAFCLYNSKYYSIDNGHIGVQNLSFVLEADETINVGHGNSIQRGNSNLAYACGWDDQKIYVVDLDNVEVTDTIALPTTGYTTGVVDELNNIAYIFQRDTYPDTVENYNFFAYDITNEQILYQKKIKAFGALQACDFYNGKIYALYGLHSATLPNGGFVCDTNGTIISEFVIPTLISDEIEGIAIDRTTNKILFSGLNKNLYELVEFD